MPPRQTQQAHAPAQRELTSAQRELTSAQRELYDWLVAYIGERRPIASIIWRIEGLWRCSPM